MPADPGDVECRAKSDHRARADQNGLEEAVVHPANALKANCAHECGDLCHRDREIRALQDGRVVVKPVNGRDLERKVISRPPPAPNLAYMITAPRPDALAVRSHLNRPGRRRWSIVAHRDEAATARASATEAFAERCLDVARGLEVWQRVVTDDHNV